MTTRLKISVFLLGSLLALGTIGYTTIEGWAVLDSLYMTVITLSTVGYGELKPLSEAGRLFTSALILLGVGALAYTATATIEDLLEKGLLRRRKMERDTRRISNHVIVCGYGRMGRTVATYLQERGIPFVVVEKDPEAGRRVAEAGLLHVDGDATDDAVLALAGILRARAVAAVLREDADNLFVTLSSRKIKNDLTIVARSSSEKNESKMLAAGATRVLNPYRNGGRLMVRQLLHPSVTDFIDVISAGEETDLHLEEVELKPGSSLVGIKLSDAPIRRELDVIVVGVRQQNRELAFNPPPGLAPDSGDVLIVLGRREALTRLEQLAEGPVSPI